MMNTSSPSSDNDYLAKHVDMMLASHRKLVWTDLFVPDTNSIASISEQVWYAPFVLISHWTEQDPIFNYANKKALARFEYPWEQFITLPSRLSAEPLHQADRERLLREVAEKWYISDYAGVRITGTGKRFRITKATVWNILDDEEKYRWLAACFSEWEDL